jgi:uncharacterized lipoprotein YddW (UPF0748 family)
MTKKPKKNKNTGCGCANIPISLILIILGGGYWWFSQNKDLVMAQFSTLLQQLPIPELLPTPTVSEANNTPVELPKNPVIPSTSNPQPTPQNTTQPTPKTTPKTTAKNPWEQKQLRGIYLSRYAITNNTDEKTIRERVRYYHSQGINAIIHGVWGNACTMYNSEVMQQKFGFKSCPNLFQDQWLDWLIDEAHKHNMEVHAYFEKGIKIDENSPIFDLAVSRRWIVPGVDRTHPGVDHYVLDVEIPELAQFFHDIVVEFVTRYPGIDAVQWDDYLGYYAELPGKVDRTTSLTQFVETMISKMKQANPNVSFDICHHNPYWAREYFAADWENWSVDRVFIQVYNEDNFKEEINYVKQTDGIAITERQFHHIEYLLQEPKVKSIFIFPLSGKPEETLVKLNNLVAKIEN